MTLPVISVWKLVQKGFLELSTDLVVTLPETAQHVSQLLIANYVCIAHISIEPFEILARGSQM